MAKTYEEIRDMKRELEPEYQERHEAHKALRDFWHGRYWDRAAQGQGGVSSIFRDLTARQGDIGPDIKLVNNILKDVCVKFQTFLAPLPMIRMYTDPPSSPTRRNQATLKERYLYGTWSMNSANKILADQGWYLPLMGDCFLGIFPDFDRNICRMTLRSPEYAFPVPSFDGAGMDAVIFCWKARASAIKRRYPNYNMPTAASGRFRFRAGERRARGSDPEVEVYEYDDRGEFCRFADDQKLNGVEHNLGFSLYEHVKFINVPGEVWGHGAVEQSVNLVEMGNAYLSLMMQSAIENVFPMMVLEDPMKAPETITKGAGAVIPVNAGGKVYYLQPPAGNLLAQSGWSQEIERMIKQDASMTDSNFGVADNSIITGKAINELQGAGAGSLVEFVQGVGIGAGLVSWNEKAIQMARTMFKDDTIYLFGAETPSLASVNPRHFSMKIKGSQLVGSTRNEVVFMPYVDMHTKVVVGLQLAGAGLVSRQWQRENVGIPDSEAMDEEIVSETIQDAVLAMLVQQITDPTAAAGVEDQTVAYIETGDVHPLIGLSGPSVPGVAPNGQPPPGGPPQGGGGPPIGTLPGGGQVMSPALQMPPGSPPPTGAPQAQGAPQQETQGVTLDQAISAFQQLQGIQGRVFLVGEIIARGETADAVEVAVTVPDDRDTIARGVPFPVKFSVVSDQPNEQFVEVTPGSSSTATQGQEPTPEQLGV